MAKKRVIYRLWSDGTQIEQWAEASEAHRGLADYVRDNPEQLAQLHFALTVPDWTEGMEIVSSVHGHEIETYLHDLGYDGLEDYVDNDGIEY
jgi:hypothetical protein